jgi:hypothetical protein
MAKGSEANDVFGRRDVSGLEVDVRLEQRHLAAEVVNCLERSAQVLEGRIAEAKVGLSEGSRQELNLLNKLLEAPSSKTTAADC